MRVLVKGTLSDVVGRRSGVPKETSFGPLLFSLYASNLFDVIHTHLPSIQECICRFVLDDQVAALSTMERCVADIRYWKLHDKLKLIDEMN